MEWAAVTGISTAIIAIAVIVGAIIGVGLLRDLSRLTKTVDRFVDSIERDARPVLDQARIVLTDANRVTAKLTHEVESLTDSASDVRDRVVGAIDRVEDRLVDLDALLDVVQEEVEETVLDVGAALRTTRRGASLIGSIRKALGGGRKKKKRGRRG